MWNIRCWIVVCSSIYNGERIVYKPRSLALDVNYIQFQQWVSQGIGMPFWWNRVWDRDTYGWCEWVEGQDCQTREQIENYYKRIGILLAVGYLLGTTDIHYENLIVHGEFPVIIDLEMGIGSNRRMDPGRKFCISYAGTDIRHGNGDGGLVVQVIIPGKEK